MAHPIMFSDDDPGLAELREICHAMPGGTEVISHGRPCFRAGEKGKIFAAFGGSEKLRPGEHRRVDSALIVKIDPVELPALDADDRFFVPAYYGPAGWRALDLADPGIDWAEITELVDASYRSVAGKRLIAELDAAAG